MSDLVIETKKLTKIYGEQTAVKDGISHDNRFQYLWLL